MDRLIWTAWRAFWVGLGASVVLIAQSLLAPGLPAASTTPASDAPAVSAKASADPVISKNPFDTIHGKSAARVRGES